MTDIFDSKTDLKEGLVKDIVSIFSDAPPQKNIMNLVDDVFAEVKVRLEEMAKQARAAYYEDLFDNSLERLKTLGCPPFILKKLEIKKDEVLTNACALNIPDDRIPLVPVIPNHYLTIYSQLEMINFNGIKGETSLESSRFINVLKTNVLQNENKLVDGVYFLLDIDNGANTENLTCAEANDRIKVKNRSSLTVEDTIALLIHKDEAPTRNILAGNSRYEQDDTIPFCSIEENKICLKTCFYNSIHPNSVTPSCGARV